VKKPLRYLIVPIEKGLERARIVGADFDSLLRTVIAQFAYIGHSARRSSENITVAELVGIGVQDLAAAEVSIEN
jgi:hypothetical protein